jgi:hypothetical protein
MTTTRISHTGHNHPNTTAARTACRKAMKATKATVVGVTVGKGKAIHIAEANMDDTIWGVRCGAGATRVGNASTWTSLGRIDLDQVTCRSCNAKHGQAHG